MPVFNAHLGAKLMADGDQFRVFVWTIDHPAGRGLVDTGMIDSRAEIADMSPTAHPENIPRGVALRSASSAAARPRDGVACSRSERLRGVLTRRGRRSRSIARRQARTRRASRRADEGAEVQALLAGAEAEKSG